MKLSQKVTMLTACSILLLACAIASYPTKAFAQDMQKHTDPAIQHVVLDESDEQWHAVADWPQQTDIPFTLTGTLPEGLRNRDVFPYWLVVRTEAGLQYVKDSAKVTLTSANGSAKDITGELSVRVQGSRLYVGAEDLLTAIPDVQETDTLTLSYDARLTSKAVCGYEAGNASFAHVEYEAYKSAAARLTARIPSVLFVARLMLADASTTPSDAASGTSSSVELTSSPESKAVVYTYQIQVNKVSSDGKPLSGARLALRDSNGLWYVSGGEWSKDKSSATVRTTSKKGAATFQRVDADSYEVVELSAPSGYTAVDPVDVSIESSAPKGNLTLSASSKRGSVEEVDATKGIVQLAITDPQGSSAKKSSSASSSARSSKLAGTGDMSLAVWPALALSILALLGYAYVRVGASRKECSDAQNN